MQTAILLKPITDEVSNKTTYQPMRIVRSIDADGEEGPNPPIAYNGLCRIVIPANLHINSSYVNTSVDPVENWITKFFSMLSLTELSTEERQTLLEEEANSVDGTNWETDVRELFGTLPGEKTKGAPIYKGEDTVSYQYFLQGLVTHGMFGATNTATLKFELDTDLVELNKDRIMQYLGIALSRLYPRQTPYHVSPRAVFGYAIGEQTPTGILFGITAFAARNGTLYRVTPADPGYVKADNIVCTVTNDNIVDGVNGILKVGHGDAHPETGGVYDPVNWPSNLYSGNGPYTINNLDVKTYLWMYNDLTSWEVWEPSSAKQYLLSGFKECETYINIPTPYFYTRNVRLRSYLTMTHLPDSKMLLWKLYVVEYDQETDEKQKCWLATMYSRILKHVSPVGTYTLRYMAAKKEGAWHCEDVTSKSNIKIDVTAYTPSM